MSVENRRSLKLDKSLIFKFKLKMEKTHKVIMIPTDKESRLFKHNVTDDLYLHDKVTDEIPHNYEAQHLCFVSDEKTKEGDWYIDEVKGKFLLLRASPQDSYEKITASAGKLQITCTLDACPHQHKCSEGCFDSKQLPQIPESFVTAYVKAGGIDEVQVEYDCIASAKMTMIDFSGQEEPYDLTKSKCIESKLKTRDDNTVIVHRSKMYSREEVIEILESLKLYDGGVMQSIAESAHNSIFNDHINKWINENL